MDFSAKGCVTTHKTSDLWLVFLFHISPSISLLAALHLVWCQSLLVSAVWFVYRPSGGVSHWREEKQQEQVIIWLTAHRCSAYYPREHWHKQCNPISSAGRHTPFLFLLIHFLVKPSPRGGAWCVRRWDKIKCERASWRRKEEREECRDR